MKEKSRWEANEHAVKAPLKITTTISIQAARQADPKQLPSCQVT